MLKRETLITCTQLGIPTANLPVDSGITPWISDVKSGVYFGWAALELPPSHPDYGKGSASSTSSGEEKPKFSLFPMVMSIGYHPFYQNTVGSAEVHVLHAFAADFYDVEMRLLILGYIRDERSYPSVGDLIKDINFDCDVARKSLEREGWRPEGLGGKLDGSWLTR